MSSQEFILTQFADALPFGVYIVDRGQKVLYWNKAAERITGYLSQEVVGRSCRDDVLVHCLPSGPCACNSPHCPITAALDAALSVDTQLFLRHKQGHRVPVRVRAVPLCDSHGDIVAIAQWFQDARFGNDPWWLASGSIARHDAEGSGPRATLAQLRLCMAQSAANFAIFLIGIERQRDLEKARGTEMVLAAHRALGQTIVQVLMVPHYLGAWTQQRFLLLVPHCGQATFEDLLNTLHGVGSACSVVWWGDRIVPQVAVNATFAQAQESADALLERIDPGWAALCEPAGDL